MKAEKDKNISVNLQQKIKNIVAVAKQKNVIRSCEEAFKKYPAENENHKGNIQSYNLK